MMDFEIQRNPYPSKFHKNTLLTGFPVKKVDIKANSLQLMLVSNTMLLLSLAGRIMIFSITNDQTITQTQCCPNYLIASSNLVYFLLFLKLSF